MAEIIISPGVFQNESDQSIYSVNEEVLGTAIVGPTVFGQPFVPTYVTNYNQYKILFGEIFKPSGSAYYQEYFTSLAAKEYFANGGRTLLVTRIISGSSNLSTYATSSIFKSGSTTDQAFTLETLAWGDQMNNSGSETNGALTSGSTYNIRWEIPYTNKTTGLFTLVVRRGNDNISQKDILETWTDLSLDPQLPNYISRVIGDMKPNPDLASNPPVVKMTGSFVNKSAYIRVATIPGVMVDSIDNNGNFKLQYTASLPDFGTSGSFFGGKPDTNIGGKSYFQSASGSNIQGFTPSDYVNAFNLLQDRDKYQFNVLLAPGIALDNSTAANAMINCVENRGDAIAILDNGKWGTAVSSSATNTTNYLSNYAACYYPWVQIYSQGLMKNVWCPPSTVIGGVLAFNDTTTAEWFAPAGLNRGGIPSVILAERKVSQTDRDTLYNARVNPIATFPNVGIAVWGQKTLQKKPSALDRINVRRLLLTLKAFVNRVSRTLVFEQNTTATRNRFLAQVNPYLSSVVQRQGLYAFKVIMDETINTPDVIDRNQLVGQIYIQPTKTAEFIILNFTLLPTGATFPA